MRVRWAKFRVLAVAIAASLILGTISFLLTGGSVLEPKTTLYLYLDDATGLASGSPVRVDGISVGKVDTVELSGSNEPSRVVRVSMKVERDRLDSITADSTAQSSSDTLIGDKFVDITSGTSAQHIPPGGELRFKGGSSELMKSIDISQFQKQIKVIGDLLDDIEEARTPLGQFITGDAMYNELQTKIRQLQTSLHNAASTTGKVGHALYMDTDYQQILAPLRQLDLSLAKLQSGQGTMGQMLRDAQQFAQAQAQIANLRGSIRDLSGNEWFKSDAAYTGWTKQAVSLIRNVEEFNANPMLTRSDVYDNLNGMARDLQSTMKDFRGNPQKFLRLKVF